MPTARLAACLACLSLRRAGVFMLVCGFFQPRSQLPKPVFYYPLHWISFQTYAFYGFMNNEFGNTGGWGCPCSAMPGGCSASMVRTMRGLLP